ncbi:hypothetical protein BDZ89DRAFT_428918 [Hymenopellis radicata]|nr:hypothetical protein BDZ89DRAFT_428918 [Hymenopellis radicata]
MANDLDLVVSSFPSSSTHRLPGPISVLLHNSSALRLMFTSQLEADDYRVVFNRCMDVNGRRDEFKRLKARVFNIFNWLVGPVLLGVTWTRVRTARARDPCGVILLLLRSQRYLIQTLTLRQLKLEFGPPRNAHWKPFTTEFFFARIYGLRLFSWNFRRYSLDASANYSGRLWNSMHSNPSYQRENHD